MSLEGLGNLKNRTLVSFFGTCLFGQPRMQQLKRADVLGCSGGLVTDEFPMSPSHLASHEFSISGSSYGRFGENESSSWPIFEGIIGTVVHRTSYV